MDEPVMALEWRADALEELAAREFDFLVVGAGIVGAAIQHVESLDAEGLMGAIEEEPRHACGGGPMVSVIEAARKLGATEARLLQYADSGDVSGDKSSVVGYMAAAIW